MTGAARAWRALAGVAVAAAATVAAFLALRGPGGGTAAGGPASPSATTSAPGDASFPSAFSGSGPAEASPHADPFSGAAARYAARRAGTILVAVYDVRTGQSWRLGDGPAQDEASVVKLDILETLLAQSHGSRLPPARRALARRMIEDSDNDAATRLWDAAGGATGLAAYNAKAGLTRTTPSPCVQCAGFPWPGWGLSTTVPYDQITLLRRLTEPNPLLSAADRRYVLSLMENVTPDQAWGVSGGVPAGVTVALKNGWLPLNAAATDWQINSVGMVSGDGRDYLIAVFTTGDPAQRYGIDTVSRLSALVWSAMR